MSESIIEQQCVRLAEKHGCLLIKQTGMKGLPDRLLLSPNGSSMWIEFKAPGQSLKPLQLHWQKKLRAMGQEAEEVDSVQLFRTFLPALPPQNGFQQSIKYEV